MRRSGATFGLTEAEWADARREIREAILAAAQERRMTYYSEIATCVTGTHVEPFSALMNHLLGAIFEEEHEASRPLLTSIVTHKNGDLEPGSGFYEMARALGYRFDEPYIFWATQVQDVFTRYGRSAPVQTDESH